MANAYYVSGQGNDLNSGLGVGLPFRTLQRAADLTQAGDTVYVMDGLYTQANSFTNILTIRSSGAPDAWITYKAYPGQKPKLEATNNPNAIDIEGASYIIIEGFELQGNNDNITLDYALSQKNNLNNPLTSANGIGIKPLSNQNSNVNSHHIVIRNNNIYDFGGAGIYTSSADYVTIENNIIHENAWYSPYGNSGISTFENWNSDFSTDYKMIIRGNTVYDNQELVPWYVVGAITDGNGIIVDTSNIITNGVTVSSYTGRTLIENNIVYNNGGRGIHTYLSSHVDVVNNTTYQNSQHPDIKDGEITAIDASDVRVFNNILYATAGEPANTISRTTNVVYDYNLVFNGTQFASTSDGSLNTPLSNKIGQDPLFVNPSVGDFSLQAGSSALDVGGGLTATVDFYGIQRPQGAGVDIGAIEKVVSSLQVSSPLNPPIRTNQFVKVILNALKSNGSLRSGNSAPQQQRLSFPLTRSTTVSEQALSSSSLSRQLFTKRHRRKTSSYFKAIAPYFSK